MSTTVSLAGRTIVVTGGSMGIGYACAAAALRAGGNVLIAARGEAALAAAHRRLEAYGSIDAVVCDVASEDDVVNLFARARDRFGRVDGLVHAAAVIGPIGPAIAISAEQWLETITVDLYGTFLVAREAARAMQQGDGGRIVLVSGGGAASPFPNYTAYACSKAGVVRLAETLAIELRPSGIMVNALAPGFVATRMHEATLAAGSRAGAEYLQRTVDGLAAGASPDQAAAAAVFLLSDASDGITGRLLAARWDDWSSWSVHSNDIAGSDLFTLRRITPADRGFDWP